MAAVLGCGRPASFSTRIMNIHFNSYVGPFAWWNDGLHILTALPHSFLPHVRFRNEGLDKNNVTKNQLSQNCGSVPLQRIR